MGGGREGGWERRFTYYLKYVNSLIIRHTYIHRVGRVEGLKVHIT